MVWNPDMKVTCQRLRARGKCHKVAIVAVMCRLIVLTNTLLRDRRDRGGGKAEKTPAQVVEIDL